MNIVNEIFESIKFKIYPDEDYRKKYLFRSLKRVYSLFGKEKLFLFNNLKVLNKKEDIYLKKIFQTSKIKQKKPPDFRSGVFKSFKKVYLTKWNYISVFL